MKKLAFLIAFLIALPAVLSVDLSTYPSYLQNASIIVGDNASATEVQGAVEISNALQQAGIPNSVKLSSEIVNTSGLNIISVGKTANPLTSAILGNDTYNLTNGTARIKLFDNNGSVHIVAYGNNASDTRIAEHVLANWQTLPLQGSEIIVTGTIPYLNLSKFVPYIDYSNNSNATYGYGQPWPQPVNSTTLLQYYSAVPLQINTSSNSSNQTSGNQTSNNQTSGNQSTTPVTSFSFPAASLGSASTDRGENASVSITLSNTGTVTLTGFAFSGIDSKYNFNVSGFPSSLTSGQSATLTMKSFMPFDLNAVDSEAREISVKIGTLTISTAQGASVSQDVKLQAVNELQITKVIATIDGQERDIEGKTADIHRGEKVKIRVVMKNRFSNSNKEGQDQSIDTKVTVSGDTDKLDLNDGDNVEIAADSSDELTMDGTVEDDAKGTIRLVLTAIGTDEKGAKHGDKAIIKFKVIDGPAPQAQSQSNTQPQASYIPLTEQTPDKAAQDVPPAAAAPNPEAIQTVARVSTPQIAQVMPSSFRDGTGYVALLTVMVLLMLGIVVAEIAFIMHRRRQKALEQPFEQKP